jgi:hypothetical protein
VDTRDDAVRLRALGLGAGVIHILASLSRLMAASSRQSGRRRMGRLGTWAALQLCRVKFRFSPETCPPLLRGDGPRSLGRPPVRAIDPAR